MLKTIIATTITMLLVGSAIVATSAVTACGEIEAEGCDGGTLERVCDEVPLGPSHCYWACK